MYEITVTSPCIIKEDNTMSENMTKFEKVSLIQRKYRRGLFSRNSAEKAIREVMEYTITQEYCDWLLDEYVYN